MGGLAVIILVIAASGGFAVVSFLRPSGVYRLSLTGLGAFFLGGVALLFLASPFLGSGAGLGVALIAGALSALALAFAGSATAGATLRHVCDFIGAKTRRRS